jgi:hypothetical protein
MNNEPRSQRGRFRVEWLAVAFIVLAFAAILFLELRREHQSFQAQEG